ncbi:cathepsin L-like proteinase isoform X1 [Leptinotarsa decemlineata]|uniref:cathepsin L-like proteinase isoform X1 n=2 Tax=Leptinotarsa decemlineata TaxID=7539 RepID=UPI003D30A3A2
MLDIIKLAIFIDQLLEKSCCYGQFYSNKLNSKMQLLIIFAAILVAVNATTDEEHWLEFQRTENKAYSDPSEKVRRFGVFQNNLRIIEKHNARYHQGLESYFLGVTSFADWTDEEYLDLLNFQDDEIPALNESFHVFAEDLKVADSKDWVVEGAVLPVQNQGKCQSCWAFSVNGALEGQNVIVNKVRIPLSEQQLVDCFHKTCSKGSQRNKALDYIKSNGLQADSSYPYVAKYTHCQYDSKEVILRMKGYKRLSPNEEELKKAVGTLGPISVGINARDLKLYQGGIFNPANCPTNTNHAVLAVGYGTSASGMKYWLLKNTYGVKWGEDGYLRLIRDADNKCGVATRMYYAFLK